jgi:hypothetical protein
MDLVRFQADATTAFIVLSLSLALHLPPEAIGQEVSQPMSDQPFTSGVMAAPNRVRVVATVLSVSAARDVPGKWFLALRWEQSEALRGPNFARIGERADGFTFVDDQTAAKLKELAAAGGRLVAEAEFIGGPGGGSFQLFDPIPKD